MSRQAYALLLALLVCILIGVTGLAVRVMDIYTTQRTDNQSIAFLRAQVVELKRDLHETEVALDKAALAGSALGDENETLKARAESAERLLDKRSRL